MTFTFLPVSKRPYFWTFIGKFSILGAYTDGSLPTPYLSDIYGGSVNIFCILWGPIVLQAKVITRIFLVLLILSSFACSKKKSQDTLNLGLTKGVSSLDPVRAFDQKSLMLLGQSYETLFQYHYLLRPFKIIPLLASGYPEIKNGGKTYIIRIKEKIPYHDHPAFKGKVRYVKAQDFINQIKRLGFDPLQSTGRWLFKGNIEGFKEFSDLVGNDPAKFWNQKIRGIKALDDHTLEIKLKKNISNFIHLFTFNFVVPIPSEVLKYSKNNLEATLVGTGPFYLEKYNSKGFYFKRFENF
jgi:oligopeptide transport system substrate-binding protein